MAVAASLLRPAAGAVSPGIAPATWYTFAGGGVDTFWRCSAPASVLGARVELVPPEHAAVLVTTPHDFEPFQWSIRRNGVPSYPDHEGVAVWTRPDLFRAVHSVAMGQQGIRVLAEVDDNYMSDPRLNVFMRANEVDRANQERHLKALCLHDGIVFSTAWLRDEYARTIKGWLGRQHTPELHVAHNNMPLADWPEPVPSNGRLRVGWMGSAQHIRDVKLAYPALRWAADQGHEIVMVGADFSDATGVTHPKALAWCRAWRDLWPTQIPWRDPTEYRRAALPLDIGLAPVERNVHTLGKSDVKAIEFTVSGAVCVLQNYEVYSKFWKHGETALLANSPDEFLRCVQELCRSTSLRKQLLSAAQGYVREERSDRAIRDEWGAAFRG